jgi:hypothetical protein
MADYASLLRRALQALPPDAAPEQRQALYEKARVALARQLEGKPQAQQELKALDETVLRLERELSPAPPPPLKPRYDSAALDELERFGHRGGNTQQNEVTAKNDPSPAAPAKRRQPIGPIAAITAAVVVAIGGGFFVLRDTVSDIGTTDSPAPQAQPTTRSVDPATTPVQQAAKPATPAPDPVDAPKPVEVTKPAPSAAATQTVEASKPASPPAPAPETAPPAPAQSAPSDTTATTPAPKTVQAVPLSPSGAVRASFYEQPETPGARPTEQRGSLRWREQLVPSAKGKDQPAISGTFEFLDLKLNAAVMISRNDDPAIPATHHISLLFTPLPGSQTGIRGISSIAMRSDLSQLGAPLQGVWAPASDNFALLALSKVPAAAETNLEAIRKAPWFYIDVVFTNGKRGALIFEKGETGNKVFEQVFAAWAK